MQWRPNWAARWPRRSADHIRDRPNPEQRTAKRPSLWQLFGLRANCFRLQSNSNPQPLFGGPNSLCDASSRLTASQCEISQSYRHRFLTLWDNSRARAAMGFAAAEISRNLLATNCLPPPARSSPPQKSAPAPACRAGSVCVDSETWHKAATRPRSRGGVWAQHRHHHHQKATTHTTHTARTRHARTHARAHKTPRRARGGAFCM